MWRYIEMMPVDSWEEIISFGEGGTPLVRMGHSEKAFEVDQVYVKDESVNPTGSFKARGLSAAITMARKLGVQKVAIPSAGNAGGALAAYATRGGLQSFVFVPEDTPDANILETEITATQLNLVKGVITDAGKIVAQNKEQEGWFDVSTLKEPYRIEGKKTMGYEIAEQLNWELPDVIFYPTGGGTGLIGMWKAFEEMEELGWIGSKRPRMVCVQSSGCAPIVKAFHEGRSSAPLWENAVTFASGLRVPKAVGDFLMLDILKASKGEAVEVDDKETYEAILEFGRMEGMFLCPEGAACWAAFKELRKSGWILDSDRVVIFNTGAGSKYTDSIRKFKSALQSK
jgi:threonine synthase